MAVSVCQQGECVADGSVATVQSYGQAEGYYRQLEGLDARQTQWAVMVAACLHAQGLSQEVRALFQEHSTCACAASMLQRDLKSSQYSQSVLLSVLPWLVHRPWSSTGKCTRPILPTKTACASWRPSAKSKVGIADSALGLPPAVACCHALSKRQSSISWADDKWQGLHLHAWCAIAHAILGIVIQIAW